MLLGALGTFITMEKANHQNHPMLLCSVKILPHTSATRFRQKVLVQRCANCEKTPGGRRLFWHFWAHTAICIPCNKLGAVTMNSDWDHDHVLGGNQRHFSAIQLTTDRPAPSCNPIFVQSNTLFLKVFERKLPKHCLCRTKCVKSIC